MTVARFRFAIAWESSPTNSSEAPTRKQARRVADLLPMPGGRSIAPSKRSLPGAGRARTLVVISLGHGAASGGCQGIFLENYSCVCPKRSLGSYLSSDLT